MGAFFEEFGAVKASPMTAYRLLKDNQQLLLYPGGAREVGFVQGLGLRVAWGMGGFRV